MRTKSLRLSTLLVLALVPAALAGDLEDGLALKEARKYEEALPKLQAAADADPGNAEAALALSEVHLGLGDAESAAKAARAGHDAHPQHVGLLVALARAHMMRADQAAAAGENGQLIQSFAADCDLAVKKALEIDTDNADAGFLRAKVLQHQGGSDAGLPQLEAVAGSHPDHFDTQFELGRYWFLKGRLDNADMEAWAKAEEHFTNAAGIDPQSGLALLNAAYAAQWQGKTEGLAEKYEKAAILLPGDDGPDRKSVV